MSKSVEPKTKPAAASVNCFLDSIASEQKRKDSQVLIRMMEKAVQEAPKMWGSSIIGFGSIRYKSPGTGKETDWFKIGFSPRKANLTLYLGLDIQQHADALKKLGKYKPGVGCLYINKLEDVDITVLEKIIMATVQ